MDFFSSSNVGKTTLHLISWPYRFGSNQNHWKAIAFSKTGLFWAHINHLKSDAKHFFNILCNRKKIFQIRYCVISHVKGLQSYHMSKFEFWKKNLTFWVQGCFYQVNLTWLVPGSLHSFWPQTSASASLSAPWARGMQSNSFERFIFSFTAHYL